MKKFLLWPWLVMVGWAAPAVGPLDLTPAQCKEHQLPPFSVHLDTTGTNLEASLFPERGTYLRLSGPPGGVLLFELLPCKDVKKLLQTRFPKGVLGKPGTFKLSGKTCATQGLVDGKSQARTRWCAVVLEPEGLVALFGTCQGV
jgi:hypothetical protein